MDQKLSPSVLTVFFSSLLLTLIFMYIDENFPCQPRPLPPDYPYFSTVLIILFFFSSFIFTTIKNGYFNIFMTGIFTSLSLSFFFRLFFVTFSSSAATATRAHAHPTTPLIQIAPLFLAKFFSPNHFFVSPGFFSSSPSPPPLLISFVFPPHVPLCVFFRIILVVIFSLPSQEYHIRTL